jgi:hypothetical protein
MYLWNNQDFDIEIEHPLFSSVLTNPENDSLPLCSCDFPVGLHRRPLHQQPICAPGTSCSSCVGWFFENVIGRILDSGCRIETVVGFLCVLSGCTTYPTASSYLSWMIYQLVILFKVLCCEHRDNIRISLKSLKRSKPFLSLFVTHIFVFVLSTKKPKKSVIAFCYNILSNEFG